MGILDKFEYRGKHVSIHKDYQIKVDGEFVNSNTKSLEEAINYVKISIDTKIILEDNSNLIPEEKIVDLIRKHHSVNRITDTLVESYIELASSNIFSIDPVITEIKQKTSSLPGKLEYTLEDDNTVAINEDTQHLLNTLLEDKYQIVEYMRKSKENFMHVVRELRE
jgi:hypothetical protein